MWVRLSGYWMLTGGYFWLYQCEDPRGAAGLPSYWGSNGRDTSDVEYVSQNQVNM